MKVDIFGIKIDAITTDQVLEKIKDFLTESKFHYLVTANPELALKAWADPKLLPIIHSADLVTADGVGLVWAAKFLQLRTKSLLLSLGQAYFTALMILIRKKSYYSLIPERVRGVDLMEKICETAAQKNWKVFLLGGLPGVADKTTKILKKRYLNLEIVGCDPGPVDLNSATDAENLRLIEKINMTKSDIIFVAFGQPKQDFWICANSHNLPSVRLAIGVGGSFDFISGRIKRAPEIYQELGLEWLWRLINEPSRAWRIFNATFRFIYKVTLLKKHLA